MISMQKNSHKKIMMMAHFEYSDEAHDDFSSVEISHTETAILIDWQLCCVLQFF